MVTSSATKRTAAIAQGKCANHGRLARVAGGTSEAGAARISSISIRTSPAD